MNIRYIYSIIFIYFTILNSAYADDLKKISIQLEWKHQFEFAGFYAAKEKGYYKDIGIDLQIKEYKSNINITDEVIQGRSDFGISSSSLILEKLQNKPVVLLASYFKQNALAFAVKKDIKSPSQLKGKKVMAVDWELEHTSLGVLLKDSKLSSSDITLVPHNFKIDKFVNGEVDAMSIFTTSQIYDLDKSGIEYNVLNPAQYGIYSYDVELFTSEEFINNNLNLVKEFIKATKKGWRYAFEHKKEITDLIYNKYTQRKTKDSLYFEARQTHKIFKTDIFQIGAIAPELIKLNIDMYIKLGLVKKDYDTSKILFDYYLKDINTKYKFTQKEKEYIQNNPVITIAMTNKFKPFSYLEENEHKGLEKDLLSQVSEISGLEFNIVLGQWSHILKKFKEKQVDMIGSISYTKKRESFAKFTKPYYEIPTFVFANKNDKQYIDINSLKGKRVGISRDIFYEESLRKKGIEIVELEGSEEKAQALALGEIDYFLASFTSGLKAVKKGGYTNIKAIDEFLGIKREDLRFAVNNQKEILYNIIDKSINSIKQKKLDDLINKWIIELDTNDNISLTQREKIYLKNKKVIRYCADPSWMPFESIQKGKHKGIGADFAKYFQDQIGIDFRLIYTDSWSQSIDYAKENRCDILSFLAMDTQKRRKYLNFTKPYFSTPLIVATKLNVTFITDLKKLNNKKLAIPKGYAFVDIIKERYPQIKLLEVKNVKEGLKRVKDGDLFGYIGTLASVGYMFQKEFTGELKIAGKFNETWDLGVGIVKSEPILHSIMEKTVNNIDEATYNSIINKWIAINYDNPVDYTIIWEILSVVFLILIGTIYWNRRLSNINKELNKAKLQAQEAAKLKSYFLANISHEIRTPMNAILGMNHLLKETDLNEKQYDYINKSQIASETLMKLINDILDFSKIEAGKLQIQNHNFDLSILLKNIETIINIKASEKHINFNIVYDRTLPLKLYGDSLRLSQILTNLLSNAVKFTNKGKVELVVKKVSDTKFRFLVNDTGIGLSKEQIEKLFTPFSQADESTTRRFGGTGLGLSISKELVELMDGKILVKSKLNEGTSFIFEVILKKSKEDQKVETLSNINIKKQMVKKIKNTNSIVKTNVTQKIIDQYFEELKEVIKTNRPNLCTPVIQKMDNIILDKEDKQRFKKIKSLIQRYRFKEALELFDK
ncbi:MAG: transporter substrate-binding domain-containing protein [Campylobacterota bacterium]|nr:transporter substrate-binding domain-containing protein [Campylobacterota bacterium]